MQNTQLLEMALNEKVVATNVSLSGNVPVNIQFLLFDYD